MIGFRNVDMAELRIHTPAERVAIAEGHLFRVAFAIFFQLSQAAEFQDIPLFPGVFFLPGNKKRVRRGVNVDISGTREETCAGEAVAEVLVDSYVPQTCHATVP
ncbi:Uncharacterised protein [Escherichia coli]|nr:Uncharacterised protein [Escherichia coli]